jgi:hypothetical protein
MLLAISADVKISDIPLASYRAPVRPLPLSVLWPHDEPQEMRENWVTWFDIPTQFTPHWEKDPTSIAPAAPMSEHVRGLGGGATEDER